MNNNNVNESSSLYDDIRKTQYIQQSSTNPNRVLNNAFPVNIYNNYQKKIEKNINYPASQRYTVAAPFPSDNLLDLKGTNNALGFIPSEPQNKFSTAVKIKKIKNNRDISNKNFSSNTLNSDNFNNNYNNRNKRKPMDEISTNSSQNKSPLNSSADNTQNIFRNKILNKDDIIINNKINKTVNNNALNNNLNNNNKLSKNNVNNKNSINKNINSNIINNNINNKIINNNIINNNMNNNNINKNINNNNQNNNPYKKINNNNIQNNNNKGSSNNSLERTYLQNQFMNRNIAMSSMLKKIQFFERLNKIRRERMKIFENEFQKDTFFMKKDFFDNIFINEPEIDKNCPLTLIFHYIFNPQTEISQYRYQKSFFESIFQLRGDKNIKIIYNPNDLKHVPKYFNDFNYVNNLFNNFNEKELDTFITDIENWQKTFSFELQFVHPLQNNIGQNQIEINDVAKIYFVSPNDLIIDYHSYAENFPLSDSFVSISQYNFHCDIQYDKKNGRFTFKTSAIVYNKLQIINENIIQNVIKKEANNINSVELPVHTWKPLLNIIKDESKKNRAITDRIFKDHIRNTLNKYSKNKPKINYEEEKYENENKIMNINNISMNKNNPQKLQTNSINFNNNENQNINNKEEKSINNPYKNINKNIGKQNKIINISNNNIINNDMRTIIGNNNNILKKVDNKINDFKDENNIKGKIFKEENNIKKNIELNKKINYGNINNNNKEEVENNPYLYYGVLIAFFLFIFKTVLGIESGNISSETFFNVLIIIIIGFMLIKNHIIDNNQQNRI